MGMELKKLVRLYWRLSIESATVLLEKIDHSLVILVGFFLMEVNILNLGYYFTLYLFINIVDLSPNLYGNMSEI